MHVKTPSRQIIQQQETNAQVIDNSTQGHLTCSSDFTSPEPKSASGKKTLKFLRKMHISKRLRNCSEHSKPS